jgi:competence protein ComGC
MLCNKKWKIKNKQGFILLFTLIVLLCISTIILSLFSLEVNEIKNSMLPQNEISQ